jgi:hypothetical protein
MNAAMFGMIIPERNVPNFWTAIRAPLPDGVASAPDSAVTCASRDPNEGGHGRSIERSGPLARSVS